MAHQRYLWRYPGVESLLEPYSAEPPTAEFHGIEEPMTVVWIGSRNYAVAAARLACTAILSGLKALINPAPVQDQP